MKRTTIMLPEEVDARLRIEARRRNVSIADVARDALEQYLPEHPPTRPLGFIAVGEGNRADASEQVEEIVAKAVARRRGRRRSA